MIIGLTGAIGSGKSTVAEMFSSAGFCTVDCDGISHSLDAEPSYVKAVRAHFGDGVITLAHGTPRIDRKTLAKVVFSDEKARKALQDISYPVILGIVYERAESARSLGLDTVIDAPTLFESGLDEFCDFTVGVIARDDIRRKRVIERGGISAEDIDMRIKIQPDDAFYRERCDFIIENNGTREELVSGFKHILTAIGAGGANES